MRGKKRAKKKINPTITKIEYGGVDLTEQDKIHDLYSSCVEISELCEDYIAEEQSHKEIQKNKVNEIKDILSKIAKTLD